MTNPAHGSLTARARCCAVLLLLALLPAACAGMPASPSAGAPAALAPTPTAESAPAAPVAPGPDRTVTFAFDTFPTYFPGLIMEARGLLQQRGYDLKLVPLHLGGANTESEAERFAKLATGEWDVLATPLATFARAADPQIGAVTAVINESAGADLIVARPDIATLNDLQDASIAFVPGGVSEFFLTSALQLAGLTPRDITRVERPSVAASVRAFLDGEADAVVGWIPDIRAAEHAGGAVLLSSDQLRVILDVLVTSRSAFESKPDAIQAFHDAWFDALKLMIDAPEDAGQTIVAWGHPEWTLITRPDDLQAQLQPLAQATLAANRIAFDSRLITDRIVEAHAVWQPDTALDSETVAQLVDGRFVQAAARQRALLSTQPPVNSSFLLTARQALPPDAAAPDAAAVVELSASVIDFEPESTQLTQAAQDALQEVAEVAQHARLYLVIEGSAAWPGPPGRYPAEAITRIARDRALAVAAFLTQAGVDPNQVMVTTRASQCPDCLDAAAMTRDRVVRLTLVQGGR